MIGLRTAIRVMPALWLAIPLSIVAGWYATLMVATDGYSVDATAKGTGVLGFVGSFCAVCAAWDGSRLRRANLWHAPSVRSRLAVAARWLMPTGAVGLVAVIAAVAVALVRAHAGPPDLRFLAVAALDIVALSAAGFTIGLVMPFALAGPLAIVAPYLWLGFVPAMYPVWLRHLTGMFRDCCGLAADLAPRAIVGSALVDFGIVGASVALVAGPTSRLRRAATAGSALGLALVGGVALVAGMTYAPTVSRDPSALVCESNSGVVVCLWPEHREERTTVVDAVLAARQRWQTAGIHVPSTVTEADPSVAPPGSLTFSLTGRNTKTDDAILALAGGLLPPYPECSAGAVGWSAAEYLQAWYAVVGGVSQARVEQEFGRPAEPDYPAPLSIVQDLQGTSAGQRAAWVDRVRALTKECDTWSPGVIAVVP